MREVVIVAGARTPFGKFGGVLKELKAVDLGAIAIRGTLFRAEERTAQGPDGGSTAAVRAPHMDGVIMGMVLQAGAGQNPARQAARLAGLSWELPAETINKVCASGLRAITMAAQIIRSGDADSFIAGGMESMSNAPFAVFSEARWGLRSGDSGLIDLMIRDGLHCAFDHVHMAIHGNQAAAEYGISREEQDAWALRSHMRAVDAIRAGKLSNEIAAVTTAARREQVHQLYITDECPRADTDAAKLAKLSPLFDGKGTITAGNAPGVNDGAAALLVMSKESALREGYKPMASILAHASVGAEASHIAATPALAIRKLLLQTGFALEDIDLFEINEAFAAVVLTSGQLLGWDSEKVNVNGGAIALGHPIGASGARIVLTLISELQRRGGGLGIAAICSGGAQGDAVLIRVEG